MLPACRPPVQRRPTNLSASGAPPHPGAVQRKINDKDLETYQQDNGLTYFRTLLTEAEQKKFDAQLATKDDMTLQTFIATNVSSTPYKNWLTPTNLEFISVPEDPKKDTGMPGSIYFKGGRIRLVHKSGPEVSQHAFLSRYLLTKQGQELYNELKDDEAPLDKIYDEIYGQLLDLPDNFDNEDDDGIQQRLFEVFWRSDADDAKIRGVHLSRGGPKQAPNLSQQQINLIAKAAEKKQNNVMQSVYPLILG